MKTHNGVDYDLSPDYVLCGADKIGLEVFRIPNRDFPRGVARVLASSEAEARAISRVYTENQENHYED